MLFLLDYKIFGVETIKELYDSNLDLKMLSKLVEKEEDGISICCVTVFCTVLISCVFQLVLSAFCFYRKCMEVA